MWTKPLTQCCLALASKFGSDAREAMPMVCESYLIQRPKIRLQHAPSRVFCTQIHGRQMLRRKSWAQLATPSPIIRAIPWRMVPVAVTRALMVMGRILMRMVGNAYILINRLAHCASFRIRRRSCHRGIFNVLILQYFQLQCHRQNIWQRRRIRRGRLHRGLINLVCWEPVQLQNHRQHLARGRTVRNGLL